MALTVSEKEHWKTRIARKIAQATEELLSKHNPHYLKEVTASARKQTIAVMGLEELLAARKKVEESQKKLEKDAGRLAREIMGIVRGENPDTVHLHYTWESELEREIKIRQQSLEVEILAADGLGRQILKLRQEEEELLDTVWLATSPQQIRALWKSVADLLAGELTPLQQQALQTPPLEGGNQ
jgi:hypothetical protein